MKISNAEKRKYNAEGWYKRFMASEQRSCTVRIETGENTDWVTDRVQLTAKDGQNGRMVIAESTKGMTKLCLNCMTVLSRFLQVLIVYKK